MFFRLFLVLMVVSLSLNIPIAYSEQLTRAKAKELIIKNMGYPKVIHGQFKFGECVEYNKSVREWVDSLSQAGLIKYTYGFSEQRKRFEFNISLTEDAKKYVIGEPNLLSYNGCKNYNATVKVGEEHFVEITGVRKKDEKEAVIEFTTKFENKTPFSEFSTPKELEFFSIANPKLQLQQKRARFVLWDDGWRMENRFIDLFL